MNGTDIFIIIVVVFCLVVGGGVYYFGLDDERIIMDEEIIYAEVIPGDEYDDGLTYSGNLVRIKTIEGNTYILSFPRQDGVDVIDLTVNSRLELYMYNDGADDVWQVLEIYKFPEKT